MRQSLLALTVKGTGRTVYLNPDLIKAYDPDVDGTLIITGDFNIKVEEKIKTIVELINNMKGRKYEKEK